jgi:hypothetical protein
MNPSMLLYQQTGNAMTRVSMVKSLAPAMASRPCSPELAGVDPSHIGPLHMQELFQKRLVGYAEVQLPKETGAFSDLSA